MTKHLDPNLRTDRIIPQTERYAAEIEKILEPLVNKVTSAAIRGDLKVIDRYESETQKQLADLMLTETYRCWAEDNKHGIANGRREVYNVIRSATDLEGLQAWVANELEGEV